MEIYHYSFEAGILFVARLLATALALVRGLLAAGVGGAGGFVLGSGVPWVKMEVLRALRYESCPEQIDTLLSNLGA